MRAGGMSWARIARTMGITLAQSPKAAYAAEAAAPMHSAHPAGASPGAPALHSTPATKAAPIASASIAKSSGGGPTTRAEVSRAPSVPRTAKGGPAPESRRTPARTRVADDGAAKKEAATVRVLDGARDKAVRTAAASPTAAADTAEPEPSASERLAD